MNREDMLKWFEKHGYRYNVVGIKGRGFADRANTPTFEETYQAFSTRLKDELGMLPSHDNPLGMEPWIIADRSMEERLHPLLSSNELRDQVVDEINLKERLCKAEWFLAWWLRACEPDRDLQQIKQKTKEFLDK